MHYTIQEIAEIIGGEAHFSNASCVVTQPVFDTRTLGQASQALFFAIPGAARNGVQFVKTARALGVRNFVVPATADTSGLADANFIKVDHVLQALQTLAAHHRRTFSGPVIGITGSNGKTIVKEWLFHLLGDEFKAHRSPRSYNSQIGVAISLLGIEPWHTMAIIEAGISKPGEMEQLWQMIRPNLVVCTHLGSAHDEGFAGRQQKANEKAILFRDADVVVFPGDSHEIRTAVNAYKASQPLTRWIAWGRNESNAYRIVKEDYQSRQTQIQFIHRGSTHILEIPFSDLASSENAMSCLCALAAVERWDQAHVEAMRHLEPLENRLSFTEGRRGNYVVDDSYSNDPDSLQVALDFLIRQQPDKPACVILSDMDQSDPDKHRLASKIAGILLQKGVKQLVAVGADFTRFPELFSQFETAFFVDTNALLASGLLQELSDKAILVKGSRRFQMEKVHAILKKQLHKTHLKIDLDALRHNYRFFRGYVPQKTRIMAMVKAFGYGSGGFEVARTLQYMGVDYLAVAFADEGIALREAGIKIPIMVMNTTPSDIATRLHYQLEPVVFDEAGLLEYAKVAATASIVVHLELDTGMHRLGFSPAAIKDIAGIMPSGIRVASLFTHLAASEDPAQDDFTRQQLREFTDAADALENQLGYKPLRHALNTGGILRFPDSSMDMVRLGVGLYGVDPRKETAADLKPVTSLYTTISQIHTLQPGEGVGYGRKAVSSIARSIATLPVGYADGLRRSLGNGKWYVLIKGQKVPIVGNVCMDMCMVDVTGIDCREGDEVIVFGAENAVGQMAVCADTIPYEILTGISARVPREFVGEG
jgi:alanine racemase